MPRQYLPINNGIMCLNDVICACLLLEQKKRRSLCIVARKNAVGNWKQKPHYTLTPLVRFIFIGVQSKLIHSKVKCLHNPRL